MFIGIYTSYYGESYHACAFTIEEVIAELYRSVGDSIPIESIKFYSATPIKIRSEYIIEEAEG